MNTPARPQLLIVTGEASGDHHGAAMLEALRRTLPDVRARGVGGDALAHAGMELLYDSRHLAVVGLLEVLPQAPHILRAYRCLKAALQEDPPDLLLLIDYPEFNLRIARLARARQVPVLYYISPQVWAWRRGRARTIARLVDKMAVIFPFEVPFYERVGLDAEFVGHPLLDADLPARDSAAARARFDLTAARPIIGLLPGSRSREIADLLPVMLAAAGMIRKRFPDAGFLLPPAPGIDRARIHDQVSRSGVPVQIADTCFNEALAACDLVLVASGTATLQAAIMETPMIICYRVSFLTYWIGRLLIRVPHIGLANIVAGRGVVPELIQHEVTPSRIAAQALQILGDARRLQEMRRDLRQVREKLGRGGAARRVAAIAAAMLTGKAEPPC